MAYLLRTNEDYRLCYDEPCRPYVKSPNGTHYTTQEYNETLRTNRDEDYELELLFEYMEIDAWSDHCNNDNGIVISMDVAEYLLQGEALDVDSHVEVSISIETAS